MSTTITTNARVAIVDDHDAVRGAVSSLLRSIGYAVAEFDSAESLLAAGLPNAFHCIISDLQMPGMSGLQLLEHLRQSGCSVPLIMLTAFPEPAVRQRAQQGGAAAFLSKPFQCDELLHWVEHAVAQSFAQRAAPGASRATPSASSPSAVPLHHLGSIA